jgi:hypothetical protein
MQPSNPVDHKEKEIEAQVDIVLLLIRITANDVRSKILTANELALHTS